MPLESLPGTWRWKSLDNRTFHFDDILLRKLPSIFLVLARPYPEPQDSVEYGSNKRPLSFILSLTMGMDTF
jgi:hypothetical protein